jgi:hypothetical protein
MNRSGIGRIAIAVLDQGGESRGHRRVQMLQKKTHISFLEGHGDLSDQQGRAIETRPAVKPGEHSADSARTSKAHSS